MRFSLIAIFTLALTLGCAQQGEVREEAGAQPQPAQKHRPNAPVTPRAMQPAPSFY